MHDTDLWRCVRCEDPRDLGSLGNALLCPSCRSVQTSDNFQTREPPEFQQLILSSLEERKLVSWLISINLIPHTKIQHTKSLTLRGCMLPSSPADDTWLCEKCGKGKPAAQVPWPHQQKDKEKDLDKDKDNNIWLCEKCSKRKPADQVISDICQKSKCYKSKLERGNSNQSYQQ